VDSEERVERAIHFQCPERFPLRYAFDPQKSDMLSLGFRPAKTWTPSKDGEDEWRCTWDMLGGRIRSSLGQVKGHPLSNWSDLDCYQFPDGKAPSRFDEAKEMLVKYPKKYVVGGLGITGFNRMTFLRGFESLIKDFYCDRQMVNCLAEEVFRFEVELAEEFCNLGANAVWFADDWGTQKGLMISPPMWRDIFKPRYRWAFDRIKSLAVDVLFHSCGKISDIIPDFIEIGVDALNLNQPRLLGIEWLAETSKGKVCFICPVDMQTIMVHGTVDEIRTEAERLVRYLSSPKGGFIACADEGVDWAFIPEESIKTMMVAFEDLSRRNI